MKDIFTIEHPLTGLIVALTCSRYRQVPVSIKNNRQFIDWQRKLARRALKPVFKILDKVPEKNVDLVFNMYLDQFRSWNLPLFNNQEIVLRLPFMHFIEKHNHELSTRYLMDDLGLVFKSLRNIHTRYTTQALSIAQKELFLELILYSSLHLILGDLREDVLKIKRVEIMNIANNPRVRSFEKALVLDCYVELGKLKQIQDAMSKGSDFFNCLPAYPIPNIINALNSLFINEGSLLFFNLYLWEKAPAFLKYMGNHPGFNRKYQLIDCFNSFIRNSKNKMSAKEYESLFSEVSNNCRFVESSTRYNRTSKERQMRNKRRLNECMKSKKDLTLTQQKSPL